MPDHDPKEVLALAKAFLEEIASKGAGNVESYPTYQALRDKVRPVRPAAPPPDMTPFAPGSEAAPQSQAAHTEALLDQQFDSEGTPTDAPEAPKKRRR